MYLKSDHFLKRNALFVLILYISATLASAQVGVNVTVANGSISLNISALDSRVVSSDLSSNNNNECVRRFAPIISTLPEGCQKRIVQVFKENTASGRCCLPANFVRSVRECLRSDLNVFSKSMTGVTQRNKKSFNCFNAARDFQRKALKKEHKQNKEHKEKKDKSQKQEKGKGNKQTHFNVNENLRELLLGYNRYTHLLSKCLVAINMNSISTLARMCMSNSTLPKFFRQDASGNFVAVLKRKQDDLDLFNACHPYLKSHANFSATLKDNFLDQVNFMANVDQCNYFSDFFTFDLIRDRNDQFFPQNVVPSVSPGTLENLAANWLSCANANVNFNATLVANLNATVINAQVSNPNGLASSIGRNAINFDHIKRTFVLEKYPSFHVSCNSTNCTAYCSGCANLNWNASQAIRNSSEVSSFDVSCCNNTCVVAVVAPSGQSGSEVFQITGDNWTRRVDNLLQEKLRNAHTCFDHRRVRSNTTSNSTRNNSNVTFADDRFRTGLSDVVNNPNSYNVDYRLASALNVHVRPFGNATQTTLLNYLTHNLYNGNNSFFLACENGNCTLQCRNCNESGRHFSIFLNQTNHSTSNVNTTVSPVANTNAQTNLRRERNLSQNKENRGERRGHKQPANLPADSFLNGYLANNQYHESTFSTNQQLRIRFNITEEQRENLGNASQIQGVIRTNISLIRNASNNLRVLLSRPAYYSLYPANMTFLPSWVVSRSYNLPQFNFNFFRATYTGQRVTPVRPRANNGTAHAGNHSAANNGTAHAGNHSAANNGTRVPPPPQGNLTHPNSTNGSRPVPPPPQGNHTANHTGNHTSNGSQPRESHHMRSRNNSRGRRNRSEHRNKHSVDMRPVHNPLDWMPSLRQPFDLQAYMNVVAQKLNHLRIYAECCSLFCVTYVESFDDGYSAGSAKRVFVDFNLRNRFAIDATSLGSSQKSCMLSSLWENSTRSNWVESCQINAPFRRFPLTERCRNKMVNQCSSSGFQGIVESFAGNCNESLLCLNVTENSSEEERLRCGASISRNFLTNNLRVHYGNLVNPCDPTAVPQPRLTSLIQTHFMKRTALIQQNSTNTTTNTTVRTNTTANGTTTTTNTTTVVTTNTTSNTSSSSNSQYVNEASLTPAERNDLNSTTNTVKQKAALSVNIDNNTDVAVNTNVDAELRVLAGANANNQTSNGFFVKLSGFIVVLAVLLI